MYIYIYICICIYIYTFSAMSRLPHRTTNRMSCGWSCCCRIAFWMVSTQSLCEA